jgi:hypothetical protein
MFLENKYTKLYYKLTSSPDSNDYTENHHIISVCLGGSDDSSNLVRLSARKHFLCHYLLTKMFPKDTISWYKVNHAFMMMKCTSLNQNRYFNSRLYESLRGDFSSVMSFLQSGDKNSQFGTTWVYCPYTLISRKVPKVDLEKYLEKGCVKGRITNIEKFIQNNKNKQLNLKRRIKKINFCKICGTETRNKLYCSRNCANKNSIPPNTLGYKHTSESKYKMSNSAKNRKKAKCKYCGAMQPVNTINRYHNENCKNK